MKAHITIKVLKINKIIIDEKLALTPAIQKSFKIMIKKVCETLNKYLTEQKITSEIIWEIPKYEPTK